MAIGALTLTPAFDAAVTDYTVSTSNVTNTIRVTTATAGAAATIKVGSTAHENNAAATWQAGENVVAVTVTEGHATRIYTVKVTKT